MQKLLQGLVCHEPTVYLTIFNQFKLNELWAYQKHVNQIILNHTTLQSLALQIFEAVIRILLIVDLSLMDDSIGSGNFSVRGYLPIIQKDSSSHMHVLAVYVREGLPFAWDLSLEHSADSYLGF